MSFYPPDQITSKLLIWCFLVFKVPVCFLNSKLWSMHLTTNWIVNSQFHCNILFWHFVMSVAMKWFTSQLIQYVKWLLIDVSHKYIQHTIFDTDDCYWPQHCGNRMQADGTGRIEQVEWEHTKNKPKKRRNSRDLFTAYLAAANRVPIKTIQQLWTDLTAWMHQNWINTVIGEQGGEKSHDLVTCTVAYERQTNTNKHPAAASSLSAVAFLLLFLLMLCTPQRHTKQPALEGELRQ